MQLFSTSSCYLRLAVSPKNLKVGGLYFLRSGALRSNRVLSSFLNSVLPNIYNRRENNIKGLIGEAAQSKNIVMKDIAGKFDTFDIQSMQNDPAKVETMTVEELRATLRIIGIPAKGRVRKHDLVTTLKCFLHNKVDDINDESRKSSNNYASSENNPGGVENENDLLKRKNPSAISVSEKGTIEDNKTSGTKQSRKRAKKVTVEEGKIEFEDEHVIEEQQLSMETEVVSGKNTSHSKKIIASQTSVKEVVTSFEHHYFPEPWTVLAHKKPKKEWIPYNPKTMRPTHSRDSKTVKLMSWNVNGLRALLKLEGFSALELAQREDFDVLCLQETKLQEKDVESVKQCLIEGYENSFWTCSVSKLGYSGTAIISRMKPLSVKYGFGIPDHDSEGRLVTVEFDSFFLISGYVPNSGDGLRRLTYRVTEWDPSLSDHMKELEKTKPVILTGDLNCAHQEIDIFNPAGNKRSAGFTDEERQSFEKNFLSRGFVDTFRRQHPDVVGYTYWGYRHNGRKTNKGWRLDYFLVSESIADKVHDSYILPDVTGSDHCPIGLTLKL